MAIFRPSLITSLLLSATLSAGSALAQSDDIAATVNGHDISQSMVSYQLSQQAAQGQRSNRKQALEQLINLEILKQEAKKTGLDKDAKLQLEIAHQTTVLMANHAVQTHFKTVKADDSELQKEYDKQVAKIEGTEFKARHILVKKKEDADGIIKDLKGGKDFAEMAKEKSIGPSSTKGGDLGWFRPKTMVPAFAAALKTMKKGEYSETPVETRFGWHIILLEDVRDIPKPKFEDVKDQIRKIVLNSKLAEYVTGLRKGSTVVINSDDKK
ncbi:MAG: peptidylprolyl isomerase [Gammaproteobacteria bacterium]|nr:peptidylprolyl isomerase [Gammaproteobacteria bacterium]